MFRKIKKAAAISMVLCLLGANTVLAVAPAPDAVVTGGTLAITELAIADLTPVTLDGTTQTTTAAVTATTLTDPTGTGAGWQVNLQASDFTLDDINKALAVANGGTGILPASSLALGAVTIAIVDAGSTAIANIVNISQGKIDTTAGINILSAPLNEGMGTYTVSMDPMTLTLLPATAYAGTYTSTVTQTLTSGPVA